MHQITAAHTERERVASIRSAACAQEKQVRGWLTGRCALLREAGGEVLEGTEALGDDLVHRAALLGRGRLRAFQRLEPPAGAAVACFGRGDDARFGRLPGGLVWDAVPSILPVDIQLLCL